MEGELACLQAQRIFLNKLSYRLISYVLNSFYFCFSVLLPDKEQLLEIAKANAAAMCTKAGVPIPDNLKPRLTGQLHIPLTMPMPNMAMNAAVASMAAGRTSAQGAQHVINQAFIVQVARQATL